MRFKLLTTRNAVLIILSVLLAMCLAFGIVMLPKTALADENDSVEYATANINAVPIDEVYAHTYILGASGTDTDTITYYANMSEGWSAATANTDGKVLVRLESDWALTSYISIATGKDITIDLNGYVIDRGLTSAVSYGMVIYIVGTLTIADSNPEATHLTAGGIPKYTYNAGIADPDKPYLTQTVQTALTGGIITGGYTTNSSGGIYVNGGILTLNGGTIYGNISTYFLGGGVWLRNSSSLTMNGGGIIKNTIKYSGTNPVMGGGVALYYGDGSQFTMNGGLIADNVAQSVTTSGNGNAYGGGVSVYGTELSPATFTMNGGTINNNRTISAQRSGAASIGGAIYALYADVSLLGGEISDNRTLEMQNGVEGFYTTKSSGAVIGVTLPTKGPYVTINISDGLITRNMAYYGAINAYGKQSYMGGQLVNNASYTYHCAGIRFNNSDSSITISGTFEYHDNYVVDANYEILYDASFEMPYDDALTNNDPQSHSHDFYVGELSDNVRRSLIVYDWVLDRNVGLSVGYTDNNSQVYHVNGEKYKIPVNPNKYFESGRPNKIVEMPVLSIGADKGVGKIVLNDEGEVAFASADKKIIFTVNYTDGTNATFDYDTCDYYGIAITYTEKVIKSIEFNGVELDNSKITDVGMYEFKGRIGTDAEKGENNTKFTDITELYTIFRVVVLPKEITAEDENFDVTFDAVVFNGNEQRPVPLSITYKDVELIQGEDYTLSYANNVNAGKAQAVFTFKGSYSGEVTVNFTIDAAKETEYSITWQYFNGTNWVELSNAELIYDGTDQSGKIRAALKTDPEAENVNLYVYATDLVDSSLQNTTNLYLRVSGMFGGESVDRLLNATEYTLTIAGTGNYGLPEQKSATVTVAPQEIEFGSLDYKDSAETRLWQLMFGESTSDLRDSVTYIEEDQAVVGDKIDAYARFRDMLLTICLNPNYIFNGHLLSYYIDMAEVSYSNASATGTEKTVTDVQTTVTFVFNANFAVSGTENNTVTLNKTWHIVTINNGLLNSDGTSATLPVFTYGVQTNIQPFKPEHGNTVYFTYRQGTTALWRIAVRYNGESKTFYNFSLNESGYILDDTIPDNNYFATVINHLGAGIYQLDVHVGEYRDSDEVVYYAIDRTFTLIINSYNIGETGVANKRIAATVTTPELVYSNKATAPEVEVTFDGVKLVYGTDYTVITASVNAGDAIAQVNGLGNFGGSFEVNYKITKADNEWVSAPNIIRWVYGGFASSVNVITSIPKYMSAQESVAYTVLNSDKKAVSATLTNFHVEGAGMVTANIAAALSQLDSGTYYLVSQLNETTNYYALDTSDNPLEFNVIQATNVWLATPSIIQWQYDEFDKNVNRIYSVTKFLDENEAILYTITTDEDGLNGVEGLIDFTAENGVVSDTIGNLLNSLNVGKYYLVAKVKGSVNYEGLDVTVEFSVNQAVNDWKTPFDVISWEYDSYNAETNLILGTAEYGEVVFTVSKDGKAVEGLEAFKVVNEDIAKLLAKLDAGSYTVTAKVLTDENYTTVADGEVTLTIAKAANDWKDAFDVIGWSYGSYNKDNNKIFGSVISGMVSFSVSKDGKAIAGLESFTVENNIVSSEIANILKELSAGEYTITATVSVDGNHEAVNNGSLTLTIAKAVNAWAETPSVISWVKGEYDADENLITAVSVFGKADMVIYETTNEENVIYKVENGEVVVNELENAAIGYYTLKATVAASGDWSELEKTFTFQIFAPEGLAWWAWLLIIVAILIVIAIVFFVLHQKGVLQMLTGRFVIAMRTKMSVDATIAAVRAHKRAEEAKISIAEAEARDRSEAFKSASPEEQAAILEQKAQEAQALVKKMQGKVAQVKNKAKDIKARSAEESEYDDDDDSDNDDDE